MTDLMRRATRPTNPGEPAKECHRDEDEVYKEDIKFEDLKSLLAIMGKGLKDKSEQDGSPTTVQQIIHYVRTLSACQEIMQQIIYLIKLV